MGWSRWFGVLVCLGLGLSVGSWRGEPAAAQAAAPSNLPTIRSGLLLSSGVLGIGLTLDPAQVVPGSPEATLDGMIHANLVKLLPDGSPVDDLATSWVIASDGRTYTFTMRPHAQFSNGDPVTADDAAYSITRGMASPYAGTDVHHITGVTALDSQHLQITLDAPIVYLLTMLAQPWATVIDHRLVTDSTNAGELMNGAANIGAGPFALWCDSLRYNPASSCSSAAGQIPGSLTLLPNSKYYGPKPHVQIIMRGVQADQMTAFQAGAVDLTPVTSVPVFFDQTRDNLYSYPKSNFNFLALDLHDPPFNNVHCRLAVAYALDRETIANQVPGFKVLYDLVPPDILGFYKASDIPGHDMSRAQAESAQCPERAQTITFPYEASGTDAVNLAIAISHEIQAAGFTVSLNGLTAHDWQRITSGPLSASGYRVALEGVQGYPDPNPYLSVVHSGNPANIGGFQDPAYDSLVDQQAATRDQSTRASLVLQAQKEAVNQGAVIPLDIAYGYVVARKDVHGFVASAAMGFSPLNNDWSNVYIGNKPPGGTSIHVSAHLLQPSVRRGGREQIVVETALDASVRMTVQYPHGGTLHARGRSDPSGFWQDRWRVHTRHTGRATVRVLVTTGRSKGSQSLHFTVH
jgi:ABC-type transport system substrate-binding protein